MRVIGIDPSLTCTSIVSLCWEPTTPSNIEHEIQRIITAPKDFDSIPHRLEHMRHALLDAIKLLAKPDLVVLEGYALGSRSSHQHAIAEWGGILRWTLWSECLEYWEMPPTTLKSYITGKGNCEKSLVLREVYKRWQFDAKDDNDADAYGLARFGHEALSVDRESAAGKRVEKWIQKCKVTKPFNRAY